MSTVTRRSNLVFKYPPNLQVLDLASFVAMYRERGGVKKANPGEYLACSRTGKLIKEAKIWFGLTYCQAAWDELLTKNSGGYPLTEAELNVLGLIKTPPELPVTKELLEQHSGVASQMLFMIVQDLKKFGFIEELDEELQITTSGEKALDGIARRIYEINYIPEMLRIANHEMFFTWYKSGAKKSAKNSTQTDLF